MIADAELLRRYAEERSEPAFAELVHRHLDLVYAAALRRLGGDAHAAADVAQQVFSALARQAAALTRGVVLPGWLYATTRNAAVDFIRAEVRRRAREQEAHTMHELTSPPAPDAAWENLRPLLDAAMDELADRDREAVLLRFFARRPFAEIGTTLNLSEDAARMRVERALDKLHALLAKRGVTSTSSALGAVLAGQAAATAPAGLAASIAGSALSGAAMAGAGSLAAAIAFMSASKITVSIAVAGALATGLTVYQSNQASNAAKELAQARDDRAAMTARLSVLEAAAKAAEQELADRSAALEKQRIGAASRASAVAAPPAPDVEKARQNKALQQFLANDLELRRLRSEAYRSLFKVGNHGMFLRGIGFTPEQIDRAAEIMGENRDLRFASGAGLEGRKLEAAKAQFRAVFGDVAAEHWSRYLETWRETGIVSDLCSFQFYKDEPFTAQKMKQLTDILIGAKSPGDIQSNIYARLDWDRILREASLVLSPTQFEGLQAIAGWGKNQVMLAAMAKQSAAGTK